MREKNGQYNNNNNVNGNNNDNNLEHEDHDDIQMPQYAKGMFENFMQAYQQYVHSQSIMQEELTAVQALLNRQTNGDNNGDGGNKIGEGSAVEREENTLYERLNEFCPRYFKPSNNPWDTNKWLELMEGIFEVDCMDRHKAVLATLKLEGYAKLLWKAAKKTFDGEETEITWTFMKRVFPKKFIITHIRYEKMRGFHRLEQGRMIVMEYSNRFN